MIDKISFKPGSMIVIVGGMKARKTPKFIDFFDQFEYQSLNGKKLRYQAFSPKCAYREELHKKFNLSQNYIVSRTGAHMHATIFNDKDLDDLLYKEDKNAQIIGIEEVPLVRETQRLVEIIKGWLKNEKMVIVNGCDKTFQGLPWAPMPELMTYALEVIKIYGTCDVSGCNKDGEYSQRIGESTNLVETGTNYKIHCLEHFQPPENL